MASPRSTGVRLPVASVTKSGGVDIIGLVVSGIAAASAAAVASAVASASAVAVASAAA